MIDRSFLEKIEEMAKTEIITVDDRRYSSAPIHAVLDPQPKPITVRTLSSVISYLKANPDGLAISDLIVYIAGPEKVSLCDCLNKEWDQRDIYLEASPLLRKFPFGTYLPVEQFIIGLQSYFVQDETTVQIIKIVGNLTEGKTVNFNDDGVTQQVTAKTGIAKVENVPVPSPVLLVPFRTFLEVEQPKSRFIFRIKSGADSPMCVLMEADGGAWELEAVKNIAAWFSERNDEVTILD